MTDDHPENIDESQNFIDEPDDELQEPPRPEMKHTAVKCLALVGLVNKSIYEVVS